MSWRVQAFELEMLAVFRVDASQHIGTGHVMRCLTLAAELQRRGAEIGFVCRAMKGDLTETVRDNGLPVMVLPPGQGVVATGGPAHAAWLESDWQIDAGETKAALGDARPDWIVIDHYAIDARWEGALRGYCGRIMAVDDLADRHHDCDLLLDQTYNRMAEDYRGWTPPGCHILTGARYALLKPRFGELRDQVLPRRDGPARHVMVSFGGVDAANCTLDVLKAVQASSLPAGCRITVVMTGQSLWLESVRAFAATAAMPIEVLCDVADMASLMAQADIAIGAAGATSWERCCLGLPTILVILADNQRLIAGNLAEMGAVTIVDRDSIAQCLPREVEKLMSDAGARKAMSRAAAAVTDGSGCALVAGAILGAPQ